MVNFTHHPSNRTQKICIVQYKEKVHSKNRFRMNRYLIRMRWTLRIFLLKNCKLNDGPNVKQKLNTQKYIESLMLVRNKLWDSYA